jgi:hypothetical protein
MSDAEFNAALAAAVDEIYRASTVKESSNSTSDSHHPT